MDRITDKSKNINLATTSLRPVIISKTQLNVNPQLINKVNVRSFKIIKDPLISILILNI